MMITVSLPRSLVDNVLTELRIPVTEPQRAQLEDLATSLLWQVRVVLAASLADAPAQAPKKRRGRPRKVAAPANGAGDVAQAPRKRGRPRKVQPVVEPPTAETAAVQ